MCYPLQLSFMKRLSFPAFPRGSNSLFQPFYQAWWFCALWFVSAVSFAQTDESAPGTNASLSGTLEPSHYIGQILISLFFVLLIIFAAAWMLKRFGKINGVAGNQMKILGVMSLGQRERAVLLEIGQEQLLIGVTASRVSLLHKLEEPIAVEAPSTPTSAFAKRLQEALQQKNFVKSESEAPSPMGSSSKAPPPASEKPPGGRAND